jgi:hypothetical protein
MPPLKSTPCIPMAAGSSPIVAITARRAHSGRQVSSGDVVLVRPRSGEIYIGAGSGNKHSAPAGEYAGDVVETSAGDWLLPWRADAKERFQLMLWTPALPRCGGPRWPDQTPTLVQPTLMAERAVPNRHPSGLHDWPNANLLCLNAYTSKYQFAAGSIHSVRLYTRDEQESPGCLAPLPSSATDRSSFRFRPSKRCRSNCWTAPGKP